MSLVSEKPFKKRSLNAYLSYHESLKLHEDSTLNHNDDKQVSDESNEESNAKSTNTITDEVDEVRSPATTEEIESLKSSKSSTLNKKNMTKKNENSTVSSCLLWFHEHLIEANDPNDEESVEMMELQQEILKSQYQSDYLITLQGLIGTCVLITYAIIITHLPTFVCNLSLY